MKKAKQKIRVRPGLFAFKFMDTFSDSSDDEIRPWDGILFNPFFFLNGLTIHEERPTSPVSCRVELVCSGLGDFEDSELGSHIRDE